MDTSNLGHKKRQSITEDDNSSKRRALDTQLFPAVLGGRGLIDNTTSSINQMYPSQITTMLSEPQQGIAPNWMIQSYQMQQSILLAERNRRLQQIRNDAALYMSLTSQLMQRQQQMDLLSTLTLPTMNTLSHSNQKPELIPNMIDFRKHELGQPPTTSMSTTKVTKPRHNNRSPKRTKVDPKHNEILTSPIPHFRERPYAHLGTTSDEIWLSDFLVFLRKECMEVFEATSTNVAERKTTKGIEVGQIGLRCRFCAHTSYRSRVNRSSCFPSSISRIYQSITMMIREHFPRCNEMPVETRQKYTELKYKTKKGEIESKSFWLASAKDIGFVDTEKGIFLCKPLVLVNPSSSSSCGLQESVTAATPSVTSTSTSLSEDNKN